MGKFSVEEVKARHTEEVVEKAEAGIAMFELFIGELTDREKAIFEIGYANGYMDSNQDNEFGLQVDVLK